MRLPEPVMYKTMWGDLYTAAQMREYRNAALEEAALACEHGVLGHGECADSIRKLKEVQS